MTSRVKTPDLDDTWQRKGACRRVNDPDVFFCSDEDRPSKQRTVAEEVAIAVCGRCPVSGNCLNWALNLGEIGIWGGTTTRERKILKRVYTRGYCLRCRTRHIVTLDDAQVCMLCGLSWLI